MVEPTNYSSNVLCPIDSYSLGKCIKGDPKTVWVYVLGLFAPPANACLQGKIGEVCGLRVNPHDLQGEAHVIHLHCLQLVVTMLLH